MNYDEIADKIADVRHAVLLQQDVCAPAVDRELITAIDNWLEHYRKVAEIHW